MQTQPNLFTRDDTMFGVCQGLGEDLGFHPNILRLTLPLLLFVAPLATLAGYAAAGVVVFVTRLLVPEPRSAPDAGDARLAAHEVAGNDVDALPLAA